MSRFIKRSVLLIFTYSLALYSCTIAMGQGLDLHKLGHEALSQGASTAAAFFLYADYLRNPTEFNDLEITAYLLSEMGEYSKADSLLQRISATKSVEAFSDSLSYFYYTARARIDHSAFDNITALNCLAKIPSSHELYEFELKANCYEEIGLYDKALQTYSLIPVDDNPGRTACLIGGCYREMGRYSEAIESYAKAISSDPDWAFPYYGIGWSYELSGDEENALKYYNEGIERDQSYSYLFLMRGELFLKRGDKELAEKDFNTVLRLDKQLKDGTCRQYALFFLGRNDDALNWMNRLIEYQPNNPGHYYDKACLCCRMGLISEAIEAIGIAFEKGYRKFSHLDADDDIEPIKSNPEYIALNKKFQAKYMEELEQLKDI